MASVDVEVDIPKIGEPDLSKTAEALGKVWESVLLTGKAIVDPYDVMQIGKCYFVEELLIRVDFALEYFVAKELQDNLINS